MGRDGAWEAHHLIPANLMRPRYEHQRLFEDLAEHHGWRLDSPEDLIGLPRNLEARNRLPRAIHTRRWREWDGEVEELVRDISQAYNSGLATLQEANDQIRALMEDLRTRAQKRSEIR